MKELISLLFSCSPAINIGSIPMYLAILPDVNETIAFTIPYGIVTNPTIHIPKEQLMYDYKMRERKQVLRREMNKSDRGNKHWVRLIDSYLSQRQIQDSPKAGEGAPTHLGVRTPT